VDAAELKKLRLPWILTVRGEIIMPLSAFQALNEKQEESGGKPILESAQRRGGFRARARSGDYAGAAARFLCVSSPGRRARPPHVCIQKRLNQCATSLQGFARLADYVIRSTK